MYVYLITADWASSEGPQYRWGWPAGICGEADRGAGESGQRAGEGGAHAAVLEQGHEPGKTHTHMHAHTSLKSVVIINKT